MVWVFFRYAPLIISDYVSHQGLESWRFAMKGPLLVGISQLDQYGFGPHPSQKLQASGQIAGGKSHRDCKCGLTSMRSDKLAVVPLVLVLEKVNACRLAVPAWINQRIQLKRVHDLFNCFPKCNSL